MLLLQLQLLSRVFGALGFRVLKHGALTILPFDRCLEFAATYAAVVSSFLQFAAAVAAFAAVVAAFALLCRDTGCLSIHSAGTNNNCNNCRNNIKGI